MTMSTNTSAGDLLTFERHCDNIRHIQTTLSPSYDRNQPGRIAKALTSNILKLELFQKMWLEGAPDPIGRSEKLWGKQGWADVQKSLEEIVGTIQLLKDANNEPDNIKRGPDNTKMGRTPFWKSVKKLSMSIKPRVLTVGPAEPGSVLDLALRLGKTIHLLRIQAEVSFDLVHGIPAQGHGLAVTDPKLSRSIPIRQGAVALYQACQRSATQCELNLDLLRDRFMPPDPQNPSLPASDTDLFYNILVEPPKPDVRLWDISAESFDLLEGATMSPTIETYEKPDLAVLTSGPPSTPRTIGIQTSFSKDLYYFRVAAAHPSTAPVAKEQSLAFETSPNKASREVGALPYRTLKAKLDAAYELVQCGFYLLGTPWLASLSNKRLRRIETKDGISCFLKVKLIRVDFYYLESSTALSESSQLFEIGMILIDIALEGSDLKEDEDPYLYARRMLPKVFGKVGAKYYKACAFCVHDRRSSESYPRPEKYKDPREMGWDFYLKDLLQDYYVQVVTG